MYLNSTNLLYDVEYLIKYPNLMLSIFGVVTNIIHIYFLSQTLKKHPIFVCFMVIGIADFFQFFSVFIVETVVVINYIDNRNCVGYINVADIVFKFFTQFLYSCGTTTAGWMIIFVAIIQGQDLKFHNFWTQKLAATVSKVTVVSCTLFNVFGIFTLILIFCQLEYVVCSEKNLMQIYMETHPNGVTKMYWLAQFLGNANIFFNVISTFIYPFYLIKMGKKCVDEKKKRCSRLIIYSLLTFLISDFGNFLFELILVGRNLEGLQAQASLVLPVELHRLCLMIGANIRPWVFFTVSTEYQESMKAFFDISGGTVAKCPNICVKIRKRCFLCSFMNFAVVGETHAPEIEILGSGSVRSLPSLPEEILVKIVEKSGLKERLTLRKVSRCFRAIVDKSKLICEKIDIRFTDLFTEICIESLPMINYQQKNGGCLIDFGGNRTIMNGERHIECALRDLGTILKNPKFELRVLKTTFLLGIPFLFNGFIPTEWTPIYRFMELEDFFQRFKRRLHVKSFDIQFEVHWNDDTEPILSILPYLKPGILEKIRIKMDVDFSDQMKKVVKLEQWKQAIELDMRKTHFELSLENLTHFKRFSVFLPKITEEQVISIMETLFKSTNFESCTLNYYEDELDLDFIQSKVGPHIQDNNTGALLFKDQETKTVFEIQLGDESIDILRKC